MACSAIEMPVYTPPNPNQVDASRAFGSTLDREDLDAVFRHSAQEVGRR
jgi:hypothetical protein